jgi:hypothetical protein
MMMRLVELVVIRLSFLFFFFSGDGSVIFFSWKASRSSHDESKRVGLLEIDLNPNWLEI